MVIEWNNSLWAKEGGKSEKENEKDKLLSWGKKEMADMIRVNGHY